MNWTEVRIFTTTEGIEPVTGALIALGINGMIVEDSLDLERFLKGDTAARWDYVDDEVLKQRGRETNLRVYLADNQQGREQLQWLRQSLQAMKRQDEAGLYGRLEAELANVKEEDWANNWKKYFKPFTVGEKLVVKPSWESWEEKGSRRILEIDPGSSFGTGQHHTTRLCLEQLEALVRPGDRILDLGCGSGILFIAAMLLGADHATAVDIEENSVRVATENALKNHLDPAAFRAVQGDIISDQALRQRLGGSDPESAENASVEGPYDLVTANIVADVILAMSPYFAGFLKKGGHLLVSGIIEERQEEVQAALRQRGFRLLRENREGGWVAATYLRP
jgi:ribosomal protein L11 methyltransferase